MWQGFLKESKQYMHHPDHWKEWQAALYNEDGTVAVPGWTDANKRKAKTKFWLQFPKAWLKFHYYGIRDFCRYKIWWRIRPPRITDY